MGTQTSSEAGHAMIRPGHHRPLGTTTWMRFPDWPRGHRPPQLLDVIVQADGPDGDPDDVQRAYEVFGVFETKTGYRLHCERIAYETARERARSATDDDAFWPFHNLPRR